MTRTVLDHRRGRVHRLQPHQTAGPRRRSRPDPRRPVDRPDRLPGRRPARPGARLAGRPGRGPLGGRRRRRHRPPGGAGRDRRLGARPARDVRGQRRLVGRPARGGPAGGGPAVRLRLVERRRRRPPATERRDRPPPPDLAVRRVEAGDRGLLPGLRRDVRPGRLLAALLERLRPVLAPQAERRRGLAAGGPRRPSRSRSTATAGRPATSSTPTTWRPRSRPSWTLPRPTSRASCSRPGPASRRPSPNWPTRSAARSGGRSRSATDRRAPATSSGTWLGSTRPRRSSAIGRAVRARRRAGRHGGLVRGRARGPRARRRGGPRRVGFRVKRSG